MPLASKAIPRCMAEMQDCNTVSGDEYVGRLGFLYALSKYFLQDTENIETASIKMSILFIKINYSLLLPAVFKSNPYTSVDPNRGRRVAKVYCKAAYAARCWCIAIR